jgi:hypothetical protein
MEQKKAGLPNVDPRRTGLWLNTELLSKAHRGGDEEPTQAYWGVRRGERQGDNKDGAKKATWYKAAGDISE